MNKLYFYLAFLGLMACSRAPTSDDPIAKVNGQEIKVRDYLNLFESLKPHDISLQGQERAKMKNLVIQTLVRRSVITSKAREQNVSINQEELEEGINRYKGGYPDQIFQEMLLEGMVDEQEWREQVRQNLLIEKMFEAKKPQIAAPSLEEALSFYEDNPHLFQRAEEVKALHLVTLDEKLAAELRKQLLKDPSLKKFRELAKEHSIGPEAQENAEIVLQKGMMPEEIDDVVFSIKEGRISEVIRSSYGYHLFRVISRQPSVNLDFKQVKQQIFERLYEERKREWLEKFEEELIRSSEIQYNRELIAKL